MQEEQSSLMHTLVSNNLGQQGYNKYIWILQDFERCRVIYQSLDWSSSSSKQPFSMMEYKCSMNDMNFLLVFNEK